VTKIRNLFLAADFVQTNTDLATMEAANEAARRAVNGILKASRSDEPPCHIFQLYEPDVVTRLRALDRIRWYAEQGISKVLKNAEAAAVELVRVVPRLLTLARYPPSDD
jgi:hypothetical protein